jgi:hypothetical protein
MIDPAFAAVAAAREAHARFEQGLWAENFMVDVSLREAMRELAATIRRGGRHHRFCPRKDARAG